LNENIKGVNRYSRDGKEPPFICFKEWLLPLIHFVVTLPDPLNSYIEVWLWSNVWLTSYILLRLRILKSIDIEYVPSLKFLIPGFYQDSWSFF
jgi:hypothetical protein